MSKVEIPPFTIIIDTREQTPFSFEGLATVRRTLNAGDYSIEVDGESWGDRVAVERKSKNDAWSCVGDGRPRFERCLVRLAALDRAAIVIECSLTNMAIAPLQVKRVTPATAVGSYISWSMQYRLPVFFCDTRHFAERVTARYLASYFKHRGGNQNARRTD